MKQARGAGDGKKKRVAFIGSLSFTGLQEAGAHPSGGWLALPHRPTRGKKHQHNLIDSF